MTESVKKQLAQADKEYERGNFKAATPVAQGVVDNGNATPAQKSSAQKLLRGMGIDPVAAVIFGTTIFILLFLSLKFLL